MTLIQRQAGKHNALAIVVGKSPGYATTWTAHRLLMELRTDSGMNFGEFALHLL